MDDFYTVYSDVMKQNYNDSTKVNLIKFGLLFFLKESNFYIEKIKISKVARYVYRFLIDNDFDSNLTSNVLVKNIARYRPEDLIYHVENEVLNWIKLSNSFLQYKDSELFSINQNRLTNDQMHKIDKVVDIICIKHFNKKIEYSENVCNDFRAIKYVNGKFISVDRNEKIDINKTRVRNRAIENTKYCELCDKNDISDLKFVYIHNIFDDLNDLCDANNTLVLCEEHFRLYNSNFFRLDEFGKINVFKEHHSLDSRMRISKHNLTPQKLNYLRKNLS